MRWFAVLVIIMASGYAGLLIGGTFRKRRRQLENIAYSMRLLETEMFFARYPLVQSFENIIPRLSGEVAAIFQTCVDKLRDGSAYRGEDAFLEALEENSISFP